MPFCVCVQVTARVDTPPPHDTVQEPLPLVAHAVTHSCALQLRCVAGFADVQSEAATAAPGAALMLACTQLTVAACTPALAPATALVQSTEQALKELCAHSKQLEGAAHATLLLGRA